MKLWSDSWANGDHIAARYAAGKLDAAAGVSFADNLNPHLAWSDLPRIDFFHWLLVDLPPTLGQIAEGEFSRGFTPRGKPGPAAPHGARQGLNDYTGWFAGDADMAGNYFGYDGPFPPFNDSLVHHYVFTLYATALARLPLTGAFYGTQLRQALVGQVLDAATHSGTYTLNRRLLG